MAQTNRPLFWGIADDDSVDTELAQGIVNMCKGSFLLSILEVSRIIYHDHSAPSNLTADHIWGISDGEATCGNLILVFRNTQTARIFHESIANRAA
jgi:hypothetical protein